MTMKNSLTRRFVLRHARRAWTKSLLAVLLAALLAGTVGQFCVLRARYAALVDAVEVDVRFFNGLSYSKAKILEKSGYVRDPSYLKSFDAASGYHAMITLVFTNRLDNLYSEPVTWLEGWDEERAMEASGKYCLLPAPFMAEEGVDLGDEFRINERDLASHIVDTGQPAPGTPEEAMVLRDARRPKYTVIGRIETEDSQWLAVAPAASFQFYASYLAAELYFDSATYKLCSYYEAEEFREFAKELLLSTKNPPMFSMDTSEADRIYRIYRLIETLYPITVAAALLLGTLLPVLMILQEQQEAAILRALGWSKKLTIRRLTLEQAVLCLAGLLLAVAALFAVNGLGFLGVILVPLLYVIAHFALCVGASAAISASILQKSPMRLLQAKE